MVTCRVRESETWVPRIASARRIGGISSRWEPCKQTNTQFYHFSSPSPFLLSSSSSSAATKTHNKSQLLTTLPYTKTTRLFQTCFNNATQWHNSHHEKLRCVKIDTPHGLPKFIALKVDDTSMTWVSKSFSRKKKQNKMSSSSICPYSRVPRRTSNLS